MKPKINFITLGVKDIKQQRDFYHSKFGWKIMKDDEAIVFFQLNGIVLTLFSEEALAEDIGIKQDGSGFRRMTIAYNCESEQEVDAVFADLRKKGVRVVKEPAKVFWGGYSGYISDPESNYWEIAYNPYLKLDADGNSVEHL